MDAPNNNPGDVPRLHAEWEDVHKQLRLMEQILSDAVTLYVRGQSRRPDQILAEVERLRSVCAQRFDALSQALKA